MSLPPRVVGRARPALRRVGSATATVQTGVGVASYLTDTYGSSGVSLDSITSGAYGAIDGLAGQASTALSNAVSGAGAALSSEAQAFYDSHSTEAAQQQTEVNGIAAAASLASNSNKSCPPNSECEFETGAEVIAVYAAALTAATGPVGAVIGAIAEAVYAVAHEIIKWMGLPVDPVCVAPNPPWTRAQMLASSGVTPSQMPPGSLAALVLPVLGQAVADSVNCLPQGAGVRAYVYTSILPGLVQIWNGIAGGSTVDYFVPRIWQPGLGFESTNPFVLGGNTTSEIAAVLNHPGPTSSYMTQVFMNPAAAPFAFLPLSQVPPMSGAFVICLPQDEGKDWLRIKANAGPLKPSALKTIAAAGAGVAVAGLTTAAVYSYVSGQALGTLASEGLAAVRDFFLDL